MPQLRRGWREGRTPSTTSLSRPGRRGRDAGEPAFGRSRQLVDVPGPSRRSTTRTAAAPYHRPMASPRSFALFATALGTCAIAWNEVGLTGVWLPEADRRIAATQGRAAMRRGARKRAVGWVAEAVEAITRLLAGERVDLDRRRPRRRRHRRLRSPRLRRDANHRAGPRAHLRRGRGPGRRRRDGARGRPVARAQRDADHRAVPSRRRDRRRPRRLLRAGRHRRPSAGCWRSRTRIRPARPACSTRRARAEGRRRPRRQIARRGRADGAHAGLDRHLDRRVRAIKPRGQPGAGPGSPRLRVLPARARTAWARALGPWRSRRRPPSSRTSAR